MRLCVRWLHVCAGEEKHILRKSAFCARALTEKRILDAGSHGKAHSAQPPELQNAHFGEAHTQNAPFRESETPRVRLYVSRRLQSGALVYVVATRFAEAAAPLAQSLFSRPSERGQRGGAAGTPWWLRRSCHLTQLASQFVSRLASQQCTQMPQNGAERPNPPICVHSCVPTVARTILARHNSVHKCPKVAPRGHFSQSVYTPASSPWR